MERCTPLLHSQFLQPTFVSRREFGVAPARLMARCGHPRPTLFGSPAPVVRQIFIHARPPTHRPADCAANQELST